MSAAQPRVLVVYYSFTRQNRRVAEVIAEQMRERGCDVTVAAIELTDRRYLKRFSRFPLRHRVLDILAILPAQLRRASGAIAVPPEARDGDYDLVCVGSA